MKTGQYLRPFKAAGLCMAMGVACWTATAAAADGIDHGNMDHSKMDHSNMDHSNMDHSSMDHSSMDHGSMDHAQHGGDEHAQHMAMMNQAGYERREASYRVPDVTLIDHSGKRVSVAKLLNGDEPVMLNFIFTSCTTICPVLSATFSQVQKEYGSDLDGVKMISISIDPEYDTPARLQEYAERFNAPEGWIFLTGELDDVTRILTAFDAYRGDKMNHVPLTFVRVSANAPWVRLEGFPGANDLLREYRLSVSEYSK